MAYLRLLTNPDDDSAFLRVINTPRREIGTGTLEKLSAYAATRHCSLLNAIDELGLAENMQSRPLSRLREFASWLSNLARASESGPPLDTVHQILRDTDFRDWLNQTSSSDKVAERRWENVEELVGWLEKLQDDEHKGESLAQMVNHLALMDIIERQDEEDSGDRVVLMTLHGAKGLEFPACLSGRHGRRAAAAPQQCRGRQHCRGAPAGLCGPDACAANPGDDLRRTPPPRR